MGYSSCPASISLLCPPHFFLTKWDRARWSGHSLRKGAASAASAIGVSLDRVCFIGGWKIKPRSMTTSTPPARPRRPGGGSSDGCCRRQRRREHFGWQLHSSPSTCSYLDIGVFSTFADFGRVLIVACRECRPATRPPYPVCLFAWVERGSPGFVARSVGAAWFPGILG